MRAVAADAAAAAVDKAEEALDDRADSMPVQLDEFGRNTNLRAKRELELRAKQRQGIVKAEQVGYVTQVQKISSCPGDKFSIIWLLLETPLAVHVLHACV